MRKMTVAGSFLGASRLTLSRRLYGPRNCGAPKTMNRLVNTARSTCKASKREDAARRLQRSPVYRDSVGNRRIFTTRSQKNRELMTMESIIQAQMDSTTTIILEQALREIERADKISSSTVTAPDAADTFVSYDERSSGNEGSIREDGLPLVYNRDAIQKYWEGRPGELDARWRQFLTIVLPLLAKTLRSLLFGGLDALKKIEGELAQESRAAAEKLGPTYVKGGQMMSVRPDVLSPVVMMELAKLQDSVKEFSFDEAKSILEAELKCKIEEYFEEFEEKPAAAASLAQVYRAKIRSSEQWVAVKVQRPEALEQISKDLYVLQRAADVYQSIMNRFVPTQQTDYRALLNEWAVGLYTELDFKNEAKNQMTFKRVFQEYDIADVYVPEVLFHSRRLLITEWVQGVKISKCAPEEIKELIAIGQDCFLKQLLDIGIFHADPHPGNILKLTGESASKGTIALLDFGLIARVDPNSRDLFINAIIHLANRDYFALADDFVDLKILPPPPETNPSIVVPLMDRTLTPYVAGGGATRYRDEISKIYSKAGGFSALTADFTTVMSEVPFSIPPSFALLGRAVVTLEGIALQGNPDYQLIMSSYPSVARRLLSGGVDNTNDSTVRPLLRKALVDLLYDRNSGSQKLRTRRLYALLAAACDLSSPGGDTSTEQIAFIDLDHVDASTLKRGQIVSLLLSSRGRALRGLLLGEMEDLIDLMFRSSLRRLFSQIKLNVPTPPSVVPRFMRLPSPLEVPVPIPVPRERVKLSFTGSGLIQQLQSDYTVLWETPSNAIGALAPELTQEEEVALNSAADLLVLFGANTDIERPTEDVVRNEWLSILLKTIPGGEILDKRGGAANLADMFSDLSGDERETMMHLATTVISAINERCRQRLLSLFPN